MKDWFLGLSQREKVMVTAAAGLVLLFLFYMFLVRPLVNGYQERLETLNNKREHLNWMKQNTARAKEMLTQMDASDLNAKKSLVALVTNEFGKIGINATKINPKGKDQISLEFKDVIFVKLMEKLESFQTTYGIYVTKANIKPLENKPGRIDVKITLNRS